MRAALAFVAVLTLAAGCGGNSVSSELDEYVDNIGAQADIACDCWNEWGYTSREECVGVVEILPSTRRCIEEALNQDPDASIAWLSCINDLEAELASCLDARLICTDSSSDDPCFDDYDIGRGECIGLPANILRDLEACE